MRAKVVLYYRTKALLSGGYRMKPVVFRKGRPVAPEGALSFYLRYSANSKRHYEPVNGGLDLAFVAYQNKAVELEARRLGRSNLLNIGPKLDECSVDGKTLQKAFDEFMAMQQNKATRSRADYEYVLREFVNHCGQDKPLASTGRPCALSYRDWLYKQPFSETTRSNRMIRVNMFLRHYGITGVYQKSEWPRPNKKRPDAYSGDEFKKLLKAAKTNEERLLIELFVYSGGRRGEIAHLKKSDIRVTKDAAFVEFREKAEFGWNTKGKRDRTVRIPFDFAKRLLKARASSKDDALLFPNSQGRPNEKHMDRVIRPIFERAGLYRKGTLFHKLRRTHATLKSGKTGIQNIQGDLGHQNVQTTMKYLAALAPESKEAGQVAEAAFGSFAKK
jgi:integrase/recombinase XerD